MRKLSSTENDWIKSFVEAKNKGISNIGELQVAKILRLNTPFFGLRWNIDPFPSLVIFTEKDTSEEVEEKLYFQIADFIYFIKYLEEQGFIAIQHVTSAKSEKDYVVIYDKENYKYDEDIEKEFPFLQLGFDKFWGEMKDGNMYKVDLKTRPINLDFALLLKKYATGIIYPLPLAEDYVNNGFKTLEQLQFEQQMGAALDAAKSGRCAAIVSAVSAILALAALIVSICSYKKPTTIDNNDLIRIESAINSNHLSEPIKTTTNDTLVIRQIPITPQSKK